ncbi:alpha-crystallin B chain-like [Cylas formicarius]|uniref:alpha-crystallin B chain-like n=1 Tax=Cylas formicarius TaxID=197179 RepID=UPI002958D455|nr:alpha-crystallin B chain-like [Cylas formicarius]
MALLPLLFDHDPFCRKISRLSSFIEPEDIYQLVVPTSLSTNLKEVQEHLSQLQKDTSITVDKDTFSVSVDVQQFKPEELSVKVTDDNSITVEGKHEERQDEHGYISRHFVRKYKLPEDCDIKQLRSRLSSDGVLSITAPKKEGKRLEYKEIPIIKTGKPAASVKRLQNVSPGDRKNKKPRKDRNKI